MKTINFKKAIETLGYTIVKYNKGYNYRTAFATNENGDLYYFSIEDLRDSKPRIMYRTARDTKDYTGGANTWDFEHRLERLGYKFSEKRQKCDFNGC